MKIFYIISSLFLCISSFLNSQENKPICECLDFRQNAESYPDRWICVDEFYPLSGQRILFLNFNHIEDGSYCSHLDKWIAWDERLTDKLEVRYWRPLPVCFFGCD